MWKPLTYTSLISITQFLSITRVNADFCEWFLCHPTEQYCCGDNLCCNYFNYTTWYLWGGAVMVGLLLIVMYYIFCSNYCANRSNTESDKLPIIMR